MSARSRLIVALDKPNTAEAAEVVRKLSGQVGVFKVGLELYTAAGPGFVRELVAAGHQVFLDLKLHDIPNTVAGAVRSAAELGVSMLTIHAAGGGRMIEAAVEAARAAPASAGDSASSVSAKGSEGSFRRDKPGVMLLGVTVLTSLGDAELPEIGLTSNVADQALLLAELAKRKGCGGIVASPREAAALRRRLGPEMMIVTPGVRPAGADVGDQSRVATPAEALRSGASHLVVGRPITHAADPAAAARAILAEMEEELLTVNSR